MRKFPTFSRLPSMVAHVYGSSALSFSALMHFFSSLVISFFFSLIAKKCMNILVKSHLVKSVMNACGPFLRAALNPSMKFFTKTGF